MGCGDKDDAPIYAESLSQAATSGSDEDVSAALNAINDLKAGSVGTTYFVVEIPVVRPTTGVMDLSSANVSALVAGDQIELKFADSASTRSDSFSVVAPAGCTANVGDKVIISKNARVKSASSNIFYSNGDEYEKYDINVSFEYNSAGEISKFDYKCLAEGKYKEEGIIYNASGTHLIVTTFEYSDNKVVVTSEETEIYDGDSETVKLNSEWTLTNGAVTKVVADSYEGKDEFTYTYDGTNVKSVARKNTYSGYVSESTYNYTWSSGNIVSKMDANSSYGESYEYDDTLWNNVNIDLNELMVVLLYDTSSPPELFKKRGAASKNVMKKYSGEYSEFDFSFSYTTSANGLITGVEMSDNDSRTMTGSIIYE